MRTLVAFCLLACAAAFPQGLLEGSGEPPQDLSFRSGLNDVEILRSDFEMSDDGTFQYGFESSDSTVVDAAGEQRQIGDGAGVVMRGSYSYVSPEGQTISVSWVADEGGFRAEGDSIPAVPEYVTRLLKSLPAAPAPAPLAAVRSSAPAAPAPAEPAPAVVADEAPVALLPAVPAESEFIVLDAASEAGEPSEELLPVQTADEAAQPAEQEVVADTAAEAAADAEPQEVAVVAVAAVAGDEVASDAQVQSVVEGASSAAEAVAQVVSDVSSPLLAVEEGLADDGVPVVLL